MYYSYYFGTQALASFSIPSYLNKLLTVILTTYQNQLLYLPSDLQIWKIRANPILLNYLLFSTQINKNDICRILLHLRTLNWQCCMTLYENTRLILVSVHTLANSLCNCELHFTVKGCSDVCATFPLISGDLSWIWVTKWKEQGLTSGWDWLLKDTG